MTPAKLRYYFQASYRRKSLDKLLNINKKYFKDKVLDIGGGRRRGKFSPPSTKEWVYADISKELSPDIITDVQNMKNLKNNSFDSIKATELFEHVEYPEKGLSECYRVLKMGGILILSVPFLFPIHADPYDFQRWTDTKWKKELGIVGFKIIKFEKMGLYFIVLADMIKSLLKAFPLGIKYFTYLFYPILDIISSFDNLKCVKNNKKLNKYTTGYFMILRK